MTVPSAHTGGRTGLPTSFFQRGIAPYITIHRHWLRTGSWFWCWWRSSRPGSSTLISLGDILLRLRHSITPSRLCSAFSRGTHVSEYRPTPIPSIWILETAFVFLFATNCRSAYSLLETRLGEISETQKPYLSSAFLPHVRGERTGGKNKGGGIKDHSVLIPTKVVMNVSITALRALNLSHFL